MTKSGMDIVTLPPPMFSFGGRIPSTEIERAVLSSVLLAVDEPYYQIAWLRPDDFLYQAGGLVWEACQDLADRGKAIDLVTVTDRLRERGDLERVGGAHELSLIMDTFPSGHLEYHAQLMRSASARRSIGKLCVAVQSMCEGGEDVEVIASHLVSGVHESIGTVTRTASLASDTAEEMIREVGQAPDQNAAEAILSGFSGIDRYSMGWRPGELVILGGWPSHGKSALACVIASHVSLIQRRGVVFASLEMSRKQLVGRILSGLAGTPAAAFRWEQERRKLTRSQHDSLKKAWQRFRGGARFLIDDTGGQSPEHILGVARQAKTTGDLGLLIVDHLHLVVGDQRQGRRQELVGLTRRFKAMAKELEVPVLLLAQLRRPKEENEGNDPTVRFIKESGSAEEDTDQALLIGARTQDRPGQLKVIIAKQREGPTGAAFLSFDRTTQRIWEYDRRVG